MISQVMGWVVSACFFVAMETSFIRAYLNDSNRLKHGSFFGDYHRSLYEDTRRIAFWASILAPLVFAFLAAKALGL